ncbi:hypothetical protein P3X46_033720 [Hevea brasiliensis]|uniref:Protein kinase domain-containing protein n=1 Tax=Hevea brasiliensis TaxID=3981 RepID=A0ABQ9KC55_HEVBR|nr:hypothetical protein P3X46_033720 [Hevea brasiliensis]
MTLLDFKKSISQDPSSLLAGWTPNTSYCSWYGVTCDEFSRRVVALNFTSGCLTSFLVGTLPDSIGDLGELRALVIPHNAFFGEIPVSVCKLQFLEVLELQGNNLSRRIPDQISNLRSLGVHNLSFNSFNGNIPAILIGYGKLQVIDLSNNQFTGEIKVDSSSKCLFLRHLKLSNNLLNKSIPKEIGQCKNLRTLLLDGNFLQGRIPAEIGQISELRILDVSTNSLTKKIPEELVYCRKLSVLALTNSSNFVGNGNGDNDSGLEFNAFDRGIPYEVLMLPSLQILWAPRGNLGGLLPSNWSDSCSLRVLHLGFNSFNGVVPNGLGICKNLTFFDLSSNYLVGYLPMQLQVPCMLYFNVSQNNMSGVIPSFGKGSCDNSMLSVGQDPNFLDVEDMRNPLGSKMEEDFVIIHDYSWNKFSGLLPLFSVGNEFLGTENKPTYRLLLNNNMFNGSFPDELVSNCNDLLRFMIHSAYNQIGGSLPPSIGNLKMLQCFDLRGNKLSGTLPNQLGNLRLLKLILLGSNNVAGGIPSELGQLTSLTVLDLSHNALTRSIPASLTNAKNLEIVLLNNNGLFGEIPSSFSTLSNFTVLDVSFNHLAGRIPQLQRLTDCDWFRGNNFLDQCPDPSSNLLPNSNEDGKLQSHRNKKSFIFALVISASVVLCISLVLVVVSIHGRKKSSRLSNLGGKVMVTFADAPTELSYDSVVRATGNFSIRNLIGTGGSGSTYKAELAPGYLVAVKRLSLGRFQGIQQFDAEIRTLEAEMFLIYNYLSGGNLETFIHERSSKNVQWSPSNILLDEELNAYLSDFGLARLLEVSQTHATTDVAGTFGYVAPEYATTRRVSDKSDVYSFGVIMLELMSGRKSLDPSFSEYGNGFNIVAWAKLLIKERCSSELFSVELWEAGPKDHLLGMLKLALTCTVESLSVRPSMKRVLEKLKLFKS